MLLEDALDGLSKLSNRELTGHAAKEYLENMHASLSEENADILRRIIDRSIDCGVSTSTINKIWPNLIYDHPYQRCSSFNVKNLQNIKFPAYSQTKEDGMYVDIVVDSIPTVMSRSGRIVEFLTTESRKVFAEARQKVLQGEVLVLDDTGSIMDRKAGNGYLNSSDIDPNRIVFVLWDILPIADWKNDVCKIKYKDRLEELTTFINNSCSGCDKIKLIDTKIVHNTNEVIDHFKANVAEGREGTVIKNMHAIWKNSTSKDQVKCKIEFECDLIITEVHEGKGKNKGKLGAFTCKTSDGKLIVNVGGGFNDKMRVKLFTNDMINKIITVRANDVIESNGVWSLFLPRFIEERKDKTQADSFDRVKEQLNSVTDMLNSIS
jgi:DNA ligase-1